MNLVQSKLFQKTALVSVICFGLFLGTNLYANTDRGGLPDQTTCGAIQIVMTPSLGTHEDEVEAFINISNNQCGVSSLGFDVFFDTNFFSYLGVNPQGCLTSDWSMMDGYEVSPGQIRVGG